MSKSEPDGGPQSGGDDPKPGGALSTVSGETWRALVVVVIAIAVITTLVLQIPEAPADETDGRLVELVRLPTHTRD